MKEINFLSVCMFAYLRVVTFLDLKVIGDQQFVVRTITQTKPRSSSEKEIILDKILYIAIFVLVLCN